MKLKKVLLFFIFYAFAYAPANIMAASQAWLQAKAQLESFDARQRLSAVKFLTANTEDEETAQLLRDRLLTERNEEILVVLLEFFAKRSSRDDFFYLLDFISLAPEYRLGGRAAAIMASIHPERTRKELAILLEQNTPDLLLVFLIAFPQPDAAAREVCRRALASYDLRKSILLLPQKLQQEIISLLQGYAPFDLILPERDITSVLLLSELREYAGGSPEPEWFYGRVNASLERPLALKYLTRQGIHAASYQQLSALADGNDHERYFALRQRLLDAPLRSELAASLARIATPREFLLALLHTETFTPAEKAVFCALTYRSGISALDRRHDLYCKRKFTVGDLANLSLALRLLDESSPAQWYRYLNYPDSRYRLKAALWLKDSTVASQRPVLQALLLKETNRRVRFHLKERLHTADDNNPQEEKNLKNEKSGYSSGGGL